MRAGVTGERDEWSIVMLHPLVGRTIVCPHQDHFLYRGTETVQLRKSGYQPELLASDSVAST